MDVAEITSVLEASEFFKGFERDHIEKIGALCRIENYEPGEFIFQQGDFGENLFIIAQGHVFLERALDLGSREGSAVIGILGKGRVLGCWSTLLGESHKLMSSARCQRPTRVIALKGDDLRAMMLSNRELGFPVLEKLCFLLRDRIQAAYGAMEKI
jgi:CRP-like cAMP-binding protein